MYLYRRGLAFRKTNTLWEIIRSLLIRLCSAYCLLSIRAVVAFYSLSDTSVVLINNLLLYLSSNADKLSPKGASQSEPNFY